MCLIYECTRHTPSVLTPLAFKPLPQVCTERPLAAVQIGIAIAALEVLGASIQKYTEPGDLKFDPFGIKPEDPEELAAVQLKELKNGCVCTNVGVGTV